MLTCGLDEDTEILQRRMQAAGHNACIVVDDSNTVLGRVRLKDLNEGARRVEQVMQPGPSTFRPSVSLAEMVDYMVPRGMRQALITTSDGVLIGVLYREDAERELELRPTTSI